MRTLLWVATAIAVAGCAGGSRISPVRSGTIAMNSEVAGVLAPGDARLNDGSVYQGWRFYGTQGQLVQIDVMSDAFDAFTILEGPAGNEIARDDDTGEGQNARINVSLPVSGNYRIIANTYRQGQFGRYRVRLASTGTAAMPVAGGQIAIGQVMTSRLTAGSATNSDGRRYALWQFFGSAGQTVQIDMQSTDLDSYLILQDQNGNELERNDDGGGSLNSRIMQTLPYSGAYRILAMSYRTSGTIFGTYSLSVTPAGMPVQPVIQPMAQPMGNPFGVVGTIGLGQQAQGVLSLGDARWEDKPFQAYQFVCNAGQTFQMDILSTWDNYALVFDPMGNVVARDDDTGEGLNARVVHTCAMTGVYRLAVTVFSTSTTAGAYTLTVR